MLDVLANRRGPDKATGLFIRGVIEKVPPDAAIVRPLTVGNVAPGARDLEKA
jgi:hypothetical protein